VANGPATFSDPVPHQGPGVMGTVEDLLDRPLGDVSQQEIRTQASGAVGYQGPLQQGRGTLFTEPVLVVNQKAKLVELNNEYAIYDRNGRPLGGVTQVGQSSLKKAMRILTSVGQHMSHKLVVHDVYGSPLLELERPAKVFKSTIIIRGGSGREIGQIKQENVLGEIRFGLLSGGICYGAIKAENWWAWDFRIEDHAGTEVARITKTWAGLAKTFFTTADNYVVQIHRPLEEPLRSFAVASAVSVDLALKQYRGYIFR
jgi:uncharacterized protein YxjI